MTDPCRFFQKQLRSLKLPLLEKPITTMDLRRFRVATPRIKAASGLRQTRNLKLREDQNKQKKTLTTEPYTLKPRPHTEETASWATTARSAALKPTRCCTARADHPTCSYAYVSTVIPAFASMFEDIEHLFDLLFSFASTFWHYCLHLQNDALRRLCRKKPPRYNCRRSAP